MTNLDQFESVFRAAAKADFKYEPITPRKLLLVTDLDPERGQRLERDIADYLAMLGDVELDTVLGTAFENVADLLKLIEVRRPDLIITYRHLHSDAWQWPFSLGVYLDVLTQATSTPVLVIPHPDRDGAVAGALRETRTVVAITDHLTTDPRLIHSAIPFVAEGGTLHLTHVEDELTFHRYMEVISKIPEIDTETAREHIEAQLLKEPHDYIGRCRRALEEAGLKLEVAEHVLLGHHMGDHKGLIDEYVADLLVMNTKDDDQFAMHGLAHAIAVELRDIPLLML